MRCSPQSPASGPDVVLEVTNVLSGHHYTDKKLLLRIEKNGRVEWDAGQRVGDSYERRATTMTLAQVQSVQQRLDAIDKSGMLPKMGPYNTYTDTSMELRIRITSPDGEHGFRVINPRPCGLPSCSMGKATPLPKEVKLMVCEVYKLRAQVADEPIEKMCDPGHASR
jgi:hypothetical protein